MTSHVQTHYAELDKLLRSASGVGPVASATLIAELPELGKLNRREIAVATVDLRPFDLAGALSACQRPAGAVQAHE